MGVTGAHMSVSEWVLGVGYRDGGVCSRALGVREGVEEEEKFELGKKEMS